MDIPAPEEPQIIGALSTALLAVEASRRDYKIQKGVKKDRKTY
jgi:hypothetical protein